MNLLQFLLCLAIAIASFSYYASAGECCEPDGTCYTESCFLECDQEYAFECDCSMPGCGIAVIVVVVVVGLALCVAGGAALVYLIKKKL